MRRIVATVVSIAAAGALASPASAGTFPDHQFEGRIQGDRSTYIGFDVKRANGASRVRRIFAVIPAWCHARYGGRARVRVEGSIKVRDGRFRGTLRSDFEGSPFRFKIRGRLHGKTASGRLSTRGVYEDAGTTRGGEPTICYTGVLRWRAKRGAEADPVIKPREALR